MSETMRLKGFKELDEMLKKLPEKLQNKLVKKAVSKAAILVRKEVKARAPVRAEGWEGVDYGHPPGLLKKSISISKKRSVRKSLIVYSIGSQYSYKKKFYAPYAHLVERGHRLVRGGKVWGHVPAKPFIRPAFDAKKGGAVEEMRKWLASELEKIRGS